MIQWQPRFRNHQAIEQLIPSSDFCLYVSDGTIYSRLEIFFYIEYFDTDTLFFCISYKYPILSKKGTIRS